MAHEGSFGGERGATDYWSSITKNDSGTIKVYDAVAGGNTFVVWNTADQDDYDIAATEASPGEFTFTFPSDISAGDYIVNVRKGSKADADETAVITHRESVHWDGTKILPSIAGEVDNDGTSISMAGAFKLMLSALTGKVTGGGTATISFRNIADDKDRIIATVTKDGNRTAIDTRDAT